MSNSKLAQTQLHLPKLNKTHQTIDFIESYIFRHTLISPLCSLSKLATQAVYVPCSPRWRGRSDNNYRKQHSHQSIPTICKLGYESYLRQASTTWSISCTQYGGGDVCGLSLMSFAASREHFHALASITRWREGQ